MSGRSELLGRRYGTDGRATLALSDVQRSARDEVARRIASGNYALVDVSCPLCGSDARRELARKDMYGLPVRVALCLGCGHVYTSRRLSDDALRRFYDGEYRRLDRGAPLPEASFFALERSKGEMIASHLRTAGLRLPSDHAVVEIGCGAGGTLAYFADGGHPVLGVDLGTEYLSYGVVEHGLPLYRGGLAEALGRLTEAGLRLGLVIYEQVLEHLADPVDELRRLRPALEPDAAVFVGVPGLRNVDAQYDSDFLRYLQLPHLSHFDLERVTAVAAAAGLVRRSGTEVVHAIFTPGDDLPSEVPRRDPETMLRWLRELERRHARKTAHRAARDLVRRGRRRAGAALGSGRRRLRERVRP